MKPRKPIPVKWTLFMMVLCVILSACAYMGRQYLNDSPPYMREYVFDSPSGVFPGADGRTYVVDYGKKRVLMVNGQGEITRVIRGGSDNDTHFYYASIVAEGSDGSVYIADARYARTGTIIRQERIFRFDEHGLNPTLVYTIDYDGSENPPMQYGNIRSLYEQDGKLVFSVITNGGVDVRTCDIATGELTVASYPLEGQSFSDVEVDPITGRPVFINRLGQVCAVSEDGSVGVLVDDGGIAWNLATNGSAIYYTDLSSKQLKCLNTSSGESTTIIQGENVIFTAQIRGGRILATDNVGYYDWNDSQVNYVEALNFDSPLLRAAIWSSLFLAIFALLVLVYCVLIRPRIGMKKSATFQRMVIVLCVSLSVSVLVTYITLGRMIEQQNQSIMEQLNLCNDIMVQATDVDALKRIDSVSDYRNADYNAVRKPLDKIMDMTYDNGLYYYYAIYASDGQTIYAVMDYENTVTAYYPMYDWGTEGYTDVLSSGQTIDVSADVSSYGSWSFVLKPILDTEGKPVAIMEVGTNMDDITAQNESLVIEILLTVISMSIVLLMLIIEMIFYIEHKERRQDVQTLSAGRRFPLRTLVFIAFMADCLQDPFVSILANQLYTPIWGIPQSIGAALPLSTQVLTAALFAFVCGNVIRHLGVKRMLCAGFVFQIAGFTICGLSGNYAGLLIGKALIGMGMGAILVSLNSVSASSGTEEDEAEAFTALNAGTLAGITVGAGVGSIVLAFSGFSAVYLTGAVILLLGLLIAVTGEDFREPAANRGRRKMNILHFLTDRTVWSFLLLILTPFLIGISFREYLFPIYAAQAGISETDIGRIYLGCGLIVIYVGPPLTRMLIGKLGGKWTVVMASALIAAATLLFGLYPTLPAAIIGLLLLALAISFGYAAQSTYYAGLPSVNQYGQGRAMGAYSLFDNGGQTLGPILYGFAMLMGYRAGVLVIGLVLLGLMLAFVAVNIGKGKTASMSNEADTHTAEHADL